MSPPSCDPPALLELMDEILLRIPPDEPAHLIRAALVCKPWLRTGFTNPTGPVKPPPSGSGLPDRFDRKPVEFKSKFKIACATDSDRYTDRFDRFTGRFDRFTGRYDRFGIFLFF